MKVTLRREAADMLEEGTEAQLRLLVAEETEEGSRLSAGVAECHRFIRKSLTLSIPSLD